MPGTPDGMTERLITEDYPAWFLDMDLGRLPLPQGIVPSLSNIGTVGALAAVDPAPFGEAGDKGLLLASNLRLLVADAFMALWSRYAVHGAGDDIPSLMETIARHASEIGERPSQVLLRRFGSGGRILSFDAIGREFGFSGPWALQESRNAFDRLEALTGIRSSVAARLHAIRHVAPARVDAVRAEGWAKGMAPNAVTLLALQLADLQTYRLPALGDVLMPVPGDTWTSATVLFEAAVSVASRDADVASLCRSVSGNLRCPPIAAAACARALTGIYAERPLIDVRLSLGQWDGVVDMLVTPESGQVSLAEATAALESAAGESVHPPLLRKALRDRAVHLGHDVYISRTMDRGRAPWRSSVIRRCLDIAALAPPDRTHTTLEFLEALRDTPEGVPEELDEAALESMLGRNRVLVRTRPSTWRLNDREVAGKRIPGHSGRPGQWKRGNAHDGRSRTASHSPHHGYPAFRQPNSFKSEPFDWTDRNVSTLRRMWLEGAASSEIRAALGGGITKNTVVSKARRLGLSNMHGKASG